MIKTLIIHPDDRSTDFLKAIYTPLKSYTLITAGTRKEVNTLIKAYDRIIMCGHGTGYGLLSVGKFEGSYIIDCDTVPLFEDKECIFIWCNADKFVNTYNLKGLYSGMFISEVSEANYCGLPNTSQSIITESNNTFAQLLSIIAYKPLNEAYSYTKHYYDILAQFNPVASYNAKRLYLAE